MNYKLLTVRDYAKAEGVTTTAIYNRIYHGKKLKATHKNGILQVFPKSDKTIKKPRKK